MATVKLTVHGIADGVCSLSGKDTECLKVTFDDGTAKESNLSFKSFAQLLRMKCSQEQKPTSLEKPATVPMAVPAPVAQAIPMAVANQVK